MQPLFHIILMVAKQKLNYHQVQKKLYHLQIVLWLVSIYIHILLVSVMIHSDAKRILDVFSSLTGLGHLSE